ncbi:MAG: hypothetical protein H6719_12775 [Sandaracinaceae bacterium]|nr:hypothetical protein [Sandaracinaceae bacterium]
MLRNRLTQVAGLAILLAMTPEIMAPQQVQAQCTPSVRCVTVGADGKGILGLGIIGAEIGFMLPAIIVGAGGHELDEWWAYVLFPVVFAAGGAVAGYFALEEPVQIVPATPTSPARRVNGFPEAAVAVLAVGMALIVPTFVGVLALTSYNPGASDNPSGATGEEDDEALDDDLPSDEEPSNDAVRDEEATNSALRRTLAGGPGLFRYDQGQLLLGIPMAYATDSFTQEERDHMRLSGSQDYIVPVASGVF